MPSFVFHTFNQLPLTFTNLDCVSTQTWCVENPAPRESLRTSCPRGVPTIGRVSPFPRPMVFLGEEKDPLYQGMVELGVPDETKATHLGFLYYLGLLNIGPDLFVKLNSIPQHTRFVDFGKQYPLALRIISAHDNLLAFRRRRHSLNEAISTAALRTRRNAHLYKSCDADDDTQHVDTEVITHCSASIVESVLARPSVLFVGMGQPSHVRSVPEILCTIQNPSKTLRIQ